MRISLLSLGTHSAIALVGVSLGLAFSRGEASRILDKQQTEGIRTKSDLVGTLNHHVAENIPMEFRQTRRDLAEKSPNHIGVDADGNIIVPRDLASRIEIYPLKSDLSVDKEESALLGIDDKDSIRLEDFIRDLGLEIIDREKKNYSVLSQDANQVTIKIPADPASTQSQMSYVKSSLEAISPQNARLLQASLYETLSHLTAGFGAHEKIVHFTAKKNGFYSYEIMELLPESLRILENAGASIRDYRRVALEIKEFKSKEVPDRLTHLFTID
jgi:hypothetical protein